MHSLVQFVAILEVSLLLPALRLPLLCLVIVIWNILLAKQIAAKALQHRS